MPDTFNRLEFTWCIQESGIQCNEHFCISPVGGPAVAGWSIVTRTQNGTELLLMAVHLFFQLCVIVSHFEALFTSEISFFFREPRMNYKVEPKLILFPCFMTRCPSSHVLDNFLQREDH